MSVAEDLSNEIKAATGEETIVSDLTYDLRSGSPDFVDRMVAATFAGMAMDAIEEGKHGLMTAINNGCYAHGADSRSQAGPAPRGRGDACTTPSATGPPTTTSWACRSSSRGHDVGLEQRLLLARHVRRRARLTPELRARIQASFDRAAGDEEHFPSTIDPRIYHVKLIREHLGDLRRQARARRGLRQGPLRARFQGAGAARPKSGAWTSPRRCCASCPAGIHTRAGSMTEMPFEDGFFDAAYATESLEHAVEIEKAVSEICRVVKPGGRIAIIDKNAEQWGKLETPEWERWFTREELERLLGAPLPRGVQPLHFLLGRRGAGRAVSGLAGGEVARRTGIGSDGLRGRWGGLRRHGDFFMTRRRGDAETRRNSEKGG